jgi:hypothetical protein
VVSCTPRPFCLREKGIRYTLNGRLVGPYSRSGRFEKEKISSFSLGIEQGFLGCVTRRLVAVPPASRHIQSTSVIPASAIKLFVYNGSFFPFPGRFPMLYHCNYLGYTGLLYTGSSVTSDFSDIPQQLIFFGYTVFGKIMATSQRLHCVREQGVHSSGRHEDCKCNLIAFCTRRRRGDL